MINPDSGLLRRPQSPHSFGSDPCDPSEGCYLLKETLLRMRLKNSTREEGGLDAVSGLLVLFVNILGFGIC